MSQSTKLVVLVGVALVVVGVVAGLLTIESGPMVTDCGSVFSPGNPYTEGAECGSSRSARAPFVWGPIALGAVLAVGALVIAPGRKKPAPADESGK